MSSGNDEAQFIEQWPQYVDGHGAGLRETGARLGIQVDAQLVGVLGIGATHLPWMQCDRAHLRRPNDGGRMSHLQRVGGTPRWERDPAGLQVVGMMLGYPLLVDLLPVDAVGKALQMGGAVPQRSEHRPLGHRQVVLNEFAFGAG
jgi:hypothetical protein